MKWSLVLTGVLFFVLPVLSDGEVQSQTYLSGDPSVSETKAWPKQLSVLTFNTWGMWMGPIHVGKNWPERLPRIAQAIRQANADVVLFQELWRKQDRKYVTDSLHEQYPYSVGSHGKMGLRGLIGSGLLVLSKYPFFAPEQFHVYKDFTAPEEFFAGKGLLIVPISINGKLFAFGNTHLGSAHWDAKINDFKPKQLAQHVRQLEQMGELIAEARHSFDERGLHPHFILSGDTNCPEYFWNAAENRTETDKPSYCYPSLNPNGELLDTYRLLNPDDLGWTNGTANPYHTVGEPDARIDYIFSDVNPRVIPYSSKIIFQDTTSPLSDHYGVLTNFLLL